MNYTNIMRLGDGGLKKQAQKSPEVLKTTTPREVPRGSHPVTVKEPSETQLQWEARRRKNHPPAMRKLYDMVGLLFARLKCQKAASECDKSKNLGVHHGEKAVVAAEHECEFRERVFAREREGRMRFHSLTRGIR